VVRDRWTYGAAKPNDVRPSIGFFYLLPVALLTYVAVLFLERFPAVGLTRWTLTIGFATAICYAAACMLIRSRPRASWMHFLLALTVGVYAFSSVQLLNIFGGRTLLSVHEVEVTGRIDNKKDSTLTLAPWGAIDQPTSIKTSRPAAVGSKVEVFEVRGLLGLRYWTVRSPATRDETPSSPNP